MIQKVCLSDSACLDVVLTINKALFLLTTNQPADSQGCAAQMKDVTKGTSDTFLTCLEGAVGGKKQQSAFNSVWIRPTSTCKVT